MIDVSKIVPKELDPNKEYIVRVRSINPLGTPSTWSEGLYIDTSRVSSEAGLFTQSNSEFSILNDEGEIVFGAFTTKRQRSNLIANPSFELDLVGWSALANSTITRLSAQAFYGGNSASIKPQTPITTSANLGIKLSSSDYVSVGVNEYYTVSLYVYREYNIGEHAGINSENSFVELSADLYDGSNNLKSRIKPSQSTRIPNNKWTRVYVENVRIPTGVSKIGLTLKIDDTITQPLFSTNERMFVDGVLLEEASKLDSYFDGSTVAGSTSWSSAPHASQSVFNNATASTVFINGALNIGGLLESTNFVDEAGVYSLSGTQIDLSQGTFTSPNFSIDAAGDVYIASGVTVEGYIQVGGAAGDINSNATTISGGKITTGTIEGDRISATTSLQVGDDNGSTYPYIVIEGGATPTQTFIKTSGSSYGTGTGFYLDAAGRFSLGTALTYDNGVLTIGGAAGGLEYIPIGGAANDINANVTKISGGKITTGSIQAISIATGTLTADNIAVGGLNLADIFADGVITATKLASDALKSINYDPPDGPDIFADLGGYFDLSNGKFTSKGLVVDNITGDVWIQTLNLSGIVISDTIRLAASDDVTLASINHPFQIGIDGGLNLAIDENEIQARNNGFAAELKLNEYGGIVTVGNGGVTSTGPLIGYNSKLSSTVALNLGTTTHALTLGNVAGVNMALDANTIQAIDNTTATPIGSTLTLNEYGGNVNIGGETFLQNSINLLNNYQIKLTGNSRIRYFDQTNEPGLTTLLGGTTLGLLIDGPHYGHVAIGLRANDDADRFVITTPGIVSDPSTALNDIVFSVNRRGDVALDRDLSIGRDFSAAQSGTIGNNLTVTGTVTAGALSTASITFDGPIINIAGATPPVSDDNKDRGIQFRWHTGAAPKVGFFGFDDSTQKFTFIPDAGVASGQYSGAKGEIDAYIDATNILNLSLSLDATYVNISGDTMTGALNTITPTVGTHAVNKTYADGLITTHVGLADPHTQYVLAAGDTMSGNLLMAGNHIQLSAGVLALNGLGNDELLYVDTAPVDDITILRASKDGALRTNFSVANANQLTWNHSTGVRIYKDLLVDGNLTISGATTTISSDNLLIKDSVIRLGGTATLTVNDGMDRGVEFRYYDTTSKLGFMGWDNSTGKFALLLNTTNTGEVITGTKAELDANIDFSNILNYTGTLDGRYVNVTGDTMTGNLLGTGFGLVSGGSLLRAFNGTSDPGLSALMVGTVSGDVIVGPVNAHFVLDLKNNGPEDAFVITSRTSNVATDPPNRVSFRVRSDGDALLLGQLSLSPLAPSAINHAVRKDYADGLITTHVGLADPHTQYVLAAGDTMTGTLVVPGPGSLTVPNMSGANVRFHSNGGVELIDFPMSGKIWHDMFRFKRGLLSFEQYVSGVWGVSALDTSALFAGIGNSATNVIPGGTTTACRWTWNAQQFNYMEWIFISFSYAVGSTKSILVEWSDDGIAWTTAHSSTGCTDNTNPTWVHLGGPNYGLYQRLTITLTAGTSQSVGSIQGLTARWANQGLGPEVEYPYSWTANKQMTIQTLASQPNLLLRPTDATAQDLTRWLNNAGSTVAFVDSSGNLSALQATATSAVPTVAGHLTRKDYVDLRVLRSGDTMTGRLIFDGATGARLGTTNKWEMYLGAQGPETFNRAINSTNQVWTLWNTGGTRWIYAPAPLGTPDYTREFAYDFGTSQWAFETPVTVGVGTALTDAVQKTYVDTALLGINTDITNHISDSTDAHDASAISYVNTFIAPTNAWLSATNLQVAVNQIGAQIEAPAASTIEAILAALNNIGSPTNPIDNSNIFETGVIIADAIAAGAILASKIAANVINASHIEANSFTGNEFNARSVIRVGESGEIIIQGTDDPLTTSISARGTNPLRAYDEWVETQALTAVLPLDYNLTNRSASARRVEGPVVFHPYQAGGSGNYISIPHAANLDLTGDLAIAVRVGLADWFVDRPLLLKRQTGIDAALIPYNLSCWNPGGGAALKFSWCDVGGTARIAYGTIPHGYGPGDDGWVGVEFDIDNGAGGATARFYKSDDGKVWELIESVVVAGATSIRTNTAQVGIMGANAGETGPSGWVSNAKIIGSANLSATPIFEFDAEQDLLGTDSSTTSFVAKTGQTVTLNLDGTRTTRSTTQIIPKNTYNWVTDTPLILSAAWNPSHFADIRIPNVPFPRKGLADKVITAGADIDNSNSSVTFVLNIPENYNGLGFHGLYSDGGPDTGGGILLEGYTLRGLRSTAGAVTSAIAYTLPGPGVYAIGYRCSPGLSGAHTLFVNGNQAASVTHSVAPVCVGDTARIGSYYGKVGANGSTTTGDHNINSSGSQITIGEFILDNTANTDIWFYDYYQNLFKGFATGDGFHIDASGRFSAGTSISWDGSSRFKVGEGLSWDDQTGTLKIGAASNTNPLSNFDAVWEARLGNATIIPNTGTAGTSLNVTNTGLIRVEGPAIWAPATVPGGSNPNYLSSSSLFTGGAQEIIEVTIGITDQLDTSTSAFSRRMITGGIIFDISPGTVTNYKWGVRTALDTWQYITFPLPPANVRKFRMVWDVPGLTLTAYESTDDETWTLVGSGAISAGIDPAYAYSFASSQGNIPQLQAGNLWKVVVDEVTLLDINTGIIANLSSSATSFVDGAGKTITVNRATSGSMTTIVPSRAIYVNPDATVAGNRLEAQSSDAGLGVNDDLIFVWAGQLSTADASFRIFAETSRGTQTLEFQTRVPLSGASGIKTVLRDEIAIDQFVNGDPGLANAAIVVSSVWDRVANTLITRVHNSGGLISVEQTSTTAMASATLAPGIASSMELHPGSFIAMAKVVAPGIAASFGEAEMAKIARYLLGQLQLSGESLIESNNFYRPPGNYFSTIGSRISLASGEIITPQLSVDSTTGAARFKGELVAPSGSIGGWTIGASAITGGTTTISSAGSIYQGTGTYGNANTKWFLGSTGNFSLADKLTWDGNTLTVTGTISGGVIDIGGADTTSFHVDASGNMWLGAALLANAPFKVSSLGALDVGGADATSFHVDVDGNMWLGAATFAGATQFKVSNAGALTATNATIAGAITGGTIDIGGADTTSFHVDIDGNLWLGAASFAAATAFKVSNAGALTSTSGAIGGWLIGATSVSSTNNLIQLNSNTGIITVGNQTDKIHIVGTQTVGGADSVIRSNNETAFNTGTGFWLDASGRFSLGNKLSWNGTTLSVDGSGTFSGTITASGGTIGAIGIVSNLTGGGAATGMRVGTGAFNNANTAFYVDSAGYFSLKNQLSWNGTTLTIAGTAVIDGNALVSGTVTASKLLVTTGGDNQILNSGAEGGDINVPGQYFPAGRASSIEEAYSGTQSWKITTIAAASPSGAFWSSSRSVPSGTQFAVAAWVKAPVGTSMAIGHRFLSTVGGYLGEGSTNFTATGEWQYVKKNGLAYTGVTTPYVPAIQIYVNTANNDGRSFYVDEVQLEIGDYPSAYKPNVAEILPGTVGTVSIASGAITADKVAVDALVSKTYTYTSGNFSDSGTYFNLTGVGYIRSKNFGIDSSGNAFFKGDITGASGTFAGTITASTGSIGGWKVSPKNLASPGNDVVLDPSGAITIGSHYGSQITLDSATGASNKAFDKLATFDGLWMVSQGDSAGVPNIGTAGLALNAVNTGLIRVEGPAIWYSTSSANRLATNVGAVSTPTGDIEQVFRWKTNWDQLVSAHVRPFHTPSNDWSISLFDGILYVSYGTAGTVRTNNATANISGALGVVDGVEVSVRVRRASSTGVVTIAYRLKDTDAWTALSVTQTTPYAGVLHSWAAQSLRMHSDTAAQGGIVPIYDVIKNGFDGPALLEFMRGDVAGVASNATSFVATSGHTLTVSRATTGPVTTIVPSGVVYINPNDTVATNKVSVPNSTEFNRVAADDVTIFWVGQMGNAPTVTAILAAVDTTITAGAAGFYNETNGNTTAFLGNDTPAYDTRTLTLAAARRTEVLFHVLRENRTTGQFTYQVIDKDGLYVHNSSTASIATGTATVSLGLAAMTNLPGSMKAWGYSKGVLTAPSDADLLEMASYLLANPVIAPTSGSASIRIGGIGTFNQRDDTIYLGANQFSLGKDRFRWDGSILSIGNDFTYTSGTGVLAINGGALVAGTVTASKLNVVTEGSNLVTNGSFSGSVVNRDDWCAFSYDTAIAPWTITPSAESLRGGSTLIINAGVSDGAISRQFPVEAGKTYSFRFRNRWAAGTGVVYAGVFSSPNKSPNGFIDNTRRTSPTVGWGASYVGYNASSKAAGQTWVTREVIWTAPDDASGKHTWASIVFLNYSASTTTYEVDWVELVPLTISAQIADGAITGEKINATTSITIGTDVANKISIVGASTAANTYIRSGTTGFKSGAGIYINAEGKLYLGSIAAGKYLAYDGVNLEVTQINAGYGTIGGWTIAPSTLISASTKITLDNAGVITVGSATNGQITLTGGTSAALTKLTVGSAVSAISGIGAYLDGSGIFRVGDPAANQLYWNGSTLVINGNITATTGTIGGWGLAPTALTSTHIALNSNGSLTVGSGATRVSLFGTSNPVTTGVGTGNTTGYQVGTGSWIGGDGKLSLGGTKLYWDGGTLYIDGSAAIQGNALVNGTLTINKLAFPAPQGSNLIANYSFADGTTGGWALVEGGPASHGIIVDATSPSDNDDYVLSVGAASKAVGTKAIPVVPGKTYYLSAYVKANSSAGIYYIRLNMKDTYPVGDYVTSANRTQISGGANPAWVEGEACSTITSWTKKEYLNGNGWTVPAGVFWVSVSFYSWTGSTGLFVDEVIMAEQATTTTIQNGAITTEKLVTTAISSPGFTWNETDTYSSAGSQFNLGTGNFLSPNFRINGTTGTVSIKGTVTAETGYIGNSTQGWSISGTSITSVGGNIILDSNNRVIQLTGNDKRITLRGDGTGVGSNAINAYIAIHTFNATPNYDWPQTPFWADSSGRLSLGNKLTWANDVLTIKDGGIVGGYIQSSNYTTIWANGTYGDITAGSSTFTVTSGTPFVSTMIGATITINGAGTGGAPLVTTIAGYTSSNIVTLTIPAVTTVVSAIWVINPRNLWSYTGSYFDLSSGNISTPGLSVNAATGALAISGDVTASKFTLTDTFGIRRGVFTTGAPIYAPDGSILPNVSGTNQLDFASSTVFKDNPPSIYGTRTWLGWNNKSGRANLWSENGSGGYGSIAAGSTFFTTDAPGTFATAMVGSVITIAGAGAGGAPLVTTIGAISGTTIVTLLTGASTTVVGNATTGTGLWSLVSEGFGSITSGSTTFNTTSGQVFNSAMVGSFITIEGAGPSGTNLVATIATYLNSYSVTLSLAASTTVTANKWALTHRTNRSQQLQLDPTGGAGIHSVDYSLGATTRRSYISMQPDIADILVASGASGGYRQRIYMSQTSINIESDALSGATGNYLGNIYLRGNTTLSGNTTATFSSIAVNNTAIQFNSVLGPKINLWGTEYKIGIAGSTIYFDSGGNYDFYINNSLRHKFQGNALLQYGTQGGSILLGNAYSGNWNGVQSGSGYLLLGHGAGTTDNIYLRSGTGSGTVNIGQQHTDTMVVGTNYTNIMGMRLGAWPSDGNWTASATGPSGYLLLGGNYGGTAGSYLRATGHLYFASAGAYVRFENWIKLDSMNGGANYLAVDANGYMYTAASRRELKEDVVPLPLDTGAIIDALEPVQFIFRNLHPEFGELTPEEDAWRRNDIKYGFIVEDVVAVNEKLAVYDLPRRDVLDDEGNPVIDQDDPAKERILQEPTGELRPSDWDHKPFIAVLVKEVQELRKRIAILEKRETGL